MLLCNDSLRVCDRDWVVLRRLCENCPVCEVYTTLRQLAVLPSSGMSAVLSKMRHPKLEYCVYVQAC
jgi:hypothetical protein